MTSASAPTVAESSDEAVRSALRMSEAPAVALVVNDTEIGLLPAAGAVLSEHASAPEAASSVSAEGMVKRIVIDSLLKE
jgi:hypothetical protein